MTSLSFQMKKEPFTIIISAGPVDVLVDDMRYFDIITPYGFNGPVIIDCKEGEAKNLVADFDTAFSQYCTDHHIIAEYIRFFAVAQKP